jgi:hypothetical protein
MLKIPIHYRNRKVETIKTGDDLLSPEEAPQYHRCWRT